MDNSTRICCACKIEKILTDFYKDKYEPSGHIFKCKNCHKIHSRNNRDVKNERNRARYKSKSPHKITSITKYIPSTLFPVSLKNRFYSSVLTPNNQGCMEWVARLDNAGYGRFPIRGKNIQAHRLSFILHNGLIAKDMIVMHICDNRKCCNPEHLKLGTQKENIQDMDRKGRREKLVGSQKNCAKFKEDDVISIRERIKNGERPSRLSREYKVSQHAIHCIKYRKTWRHI